MKTLLLYNHILFYYYVENVNKKQACSRLFWNNLPQGKHFQAQKVVINVK